MGLLIRGLKLESQSLTSIILEKSIFLFCMEEEPQDKPANYLLFQHDRYRSVSFRLSPQNLKCSRRHTFKNNIIALSYSRNQIGEGSTMQYICGELKVAP